MRERDRARCASCAARSRARGPTFIVLDNHEDDREMARLLTLLDGLPVCWVITARRCLLSGVSVFPVVAPLSTARRSPFPRVAELTDVLRWNPLALDVANALCATGAVTARALRAWLVAHGVLRVAPIAHEDDLPGAAPAGRAGRGRASAARAGAC